RVASVQAGGSWVGADGGEALFAGALNGVEEFGEVRAGGVGVGEDFVPGGSAEQLVDGHVQGLALDVPQGQVDRSDGCHGDGAAAPVGTTVEVLPVVFDPVGVPSEQCGREVVAEVAGHGEFAAVQGGVAPADDAVIGGDFEGDEVAAGAGDEDVDVDDFSGHREITTFLRGWFVDRRVMFSAISRARPR